ncbi:MAG: GtrA family protein [Clostridia bacterium]|nr:GtrA family protein [Clostridia bacterium]
MKINKIFDKSFILFLIVGGINTLVSAVLMFLLEKTGYWVSTIIAYAVGAVISFFLNKKFTFKSEGKTTKSAVKFIINVAVCYIIAYSVAQPIATLILSATNLSSLWIERIAKLFGMGLYTLINYFGQKFFAFKN